MSAPAERRGRAAAVLDRLDPGAPTRVAAGLDAMGEGFADAVLGWAFADVLTRPALDLATRERLTVAMLAAMGTAPGQLDFHLRVALRVGVSRGELAEIMLQVAVYAGVPACMNGLTAVRTATGGTSDAGMT